MSVRLHIIVVHSIIMAKYSLLLSSKIGYFPHYITNTLDLANLQLLCHIIKVVKPVKPLQIVDNTECHLQSLTVTNRKDITTI